MCWFKVENPGAGACKRIYLWTRGRFCSSLIRSVWAGPKDLLFLLKKTLLLLLLIINIVMMLLLMVMMMVMMYLHAWYVHVWRTTSVGLVLFFHLTWVQAHSLS